MTGLSGEPAILSERSACFGTKAVAADAAVTETILAVPKGLQQSGPSPQGVHDMGFATEFKEFALKGNVMDLAVGVIIGAAFGRIVDSIVSDLIMPLVGRVFGGLDFSNMFIPLAGQTATNLIDARKAGAVFAYGNFITVALNFAILAFIIFIMVRQINKLKGAAPPAPPAATPEDVLLLREIRDALRK
jgi:large conductance mechanosensitive channel